MYKLFDNYLMLKMLRKKVPVDVKNCSLLVLAMLLSWYIFVGYKYSFMWNWGESMVPSYEHKEIVIVQNRYTLPDYWQPDRYDNVIVRVDREKLTKRVLALEGENVRIKHGRIYINGKERKDPYGKGDITFWTEPEDIRATKPKEEWLFLNVDQDVGRVPHGYVFVMGDNRKISWYGMVRIEDIKALVIF